MTTPLIDPPPGTVVDGWQVSKELGNGGFASVFLGEKNGKHGAIKVARHRETSGDSKQTHARTLRELTAILMLEHPNIVRPQGHGYTTRGNVYLALDYVDGWTLAEWAERKHPTMREIVTVFEKLSGALAYMHARGILHRDLKLSNVLIRKNDGEPVIIDFSCATYIRAENLTDGGLPPGTDRYRAPEQFRFLDEHKDEHRAHYAFQVADEIFALGVMLHELLTDPRPTEFRARFNLNDARLTAPPARLVNARVPEALSGLVESMLSRNPTRRPVDTEALRRELSDLRADPLADYDLPPHPPSEQRQVEPMHEGHPAALSRQPLAAPLKRHVAFQERPPRRMWRRAGVAGVVALAVVAGLWSYASKHRAPAVEQLAPLPRSSGSNGSAPPVTAPPAMSLPNSSPMLPPGPAIDAAQKEGSALKTPAPEVPPQGRTHRQTKKPAAVVECASLSLVAALAAGCPSAQIRPESFTCPAGAERAMRENLRWSVSDRFTLVLDDRYTEGENIWFTAGGEIVGIVPKSSSGVRQREVAPPGTRFYGRAYYLSDKMGRADGPALVIRYDRVKLPGQDEQPVCFVVESPADAFKDGKVKSGNRGGGFVVDRWP